MLQKQNIYFNGTWNGRHVHKVHVTIENKKSNYYLTNQIYFYHPGFEYHATSISIFSASGEFQSCDISFEQTNFGEFEGKVVGREIYSVEKNHLNVHRTIDGFSWADTYGKISKKTFWPTVAWGFAEHIFLIQLHTLGIKKQKKYTTIPMHWWMSYAGIYERSLLVVKDEENHFYTQIKESFLGINRAITYKLTYEKESKKITSIQFLERRGLLLNQEPKSADFQRISSKILPFIENLPPKQTNKVKLFNDAQWNLIIKRNKKSSVCILFDVIQIFEPTYPISFVRNQFLKMKTSCDLAVFDRIMGTSSLADASVFGTEEVYVEFCQKLIESLRHRYDAINVLVTDWNLFLALQLFGQINHAPHILAIAPPDESPDFDFLKELTHQAVCSWINFNIHGLTANYPANITILTNKNTKTLPRNVNVLEVTLPLHRDTKNKAKNFSNVVNSYFSEKYIKIINDNLRSV